MSIQLIKEIGNPAHKLHNLLPMKLYQIRSRETRANGLKCFKFKCKSERFKNSPIVYGMDKFNLSLDNVN